MKEVYWEIKINKPGPRFLPELSLSGPAKVVYFDLPIYFLHVLKSSYSPYLYPPYLQPYPPSNKRMISRKSEKTSKTGNKILNKTGTVIDLIFCAIVIFYGILSHKLIKIESYQYKYKATTTVIHGWILDK